MALTRTTSRTASLIGLLALVASSLAFPHSASSSNILAVDNSVPYPVGANAKSVAVGDCDGDGIPDLIAAGQNSNDVTILRKTGASEYQFHARHLVASQPTGAACGDFNGDGLVDFATTSRSGGTVTIYRQALDGTFSVAGSRPAGVLPTSLIPGDVNNDGILDLIAVGERSADLTILIGTGTDVLPPFSRVRVPLDSPHAAAVADFNLDGHPDIAVAGAGAPWVVLLFGDGIGFAPKTEGVPSPFLFSTRPARGRGIAAGDLNNDGIPDLAFLSSNSIVTLYLGIGNGTFTFLDAFAVLPGAEALALTDANDDGLLDLVVVYSEFNAVQVLLASEPGKFPLPGTAPAPDVINPLGRAARRVVLLEPTDPTSTHVQILTGDAGARSLSIVEQNELQELDVSPLIDLTSPVDTLLLADMDGDGIDDAIVSGKVRRGVALEILRGTPSGAYERATPTPALCGDGIVEGAELCDDGNLKNRDGCEKTCLPTITRGIASMFAEDIDGDGQKDLVVLDQKGQVSLLIGDGAGRFRDVRILTRAQRKAQIAVADFTGDGHVDIALLPRKRRDGNLALLVNDGIGNFTSRPIPTTTRYTGPLLGGDFNRDGLPDLAVGYRGGFRVIFNDGTGPAREGAGIAAPRGLSNLAAADFNEDGWLDFVGTFSKKKTPPQLYLGINSGQFASGTAIPDATELKNPFIVDLDQDLHADIVDCAAHSAPLCRAFYGDGTGRFHAASLPAENSIGRDVRAAGAFDLDGDGNVDLVGVSRRDNQAVILFRGNGDTTLQRLVLETGFRPSSLALGDLNGDDRLDLVVGNEGSRDLSIFLNQGGRVFTAATPVRLPAAPGGLDVISLALGDLNADGLLDVAAVQAGGILTPLLNLGGGGLAALGSLSTGARPWGVAVGHLNADNFLDMVTANRDSNTFSVFLSQPDTTWTRTDYPGGGIRTSSVAVADLNGDGKDDVIVTNEKITDTATLGNVVTFLNDGNGGFSVPAVVHVRGRETPRSICSGDFDGDGNADVAVASLESNDVMLLYGNGAGGWRADEKTFPVGHKATSVLCIDADGDGRTDVAFARKQAGDVGAILSSE